ncbi:pro-neuregulin-2, membrane-bound isoform-like isoform X2 [Centruroides vittatus]|uniref:pro-neuregulin-2, membrane-bound isoform-like isoform X2 n=1 Tax=Centruroides vittatus TaxID=120091 RepID=UPI00350FFBA6
MKCFLLVFSVLSSVLARDTCHQDRTLDPISKTYLSPVVFLGKLTNVVRHENMMRTRFHVKKVLKNVGMQSKQKKRVRLEYRNSTFCELPRDMELTKEYLVFIRVNYSEVEPLFLPEPSNPKMIRNVRKIACRKCAKPPTVGRLNDVTLKPGGRLKLNCKIGGNPLPRVEWYKNGKIIEGRSRIKIKNKRKQSNLIIKSVNYKDIGEYECRVSNIVQQEAVSSKAKVMIKAFQTTTSSSKSIFEFEGSPCPMDTFCLNGGNCTFYEIFGEYVCKCAEGYIGQRCDHKSVSVILGQVMNQSEGKQGSLSYVITALFGASIWIIVILMVIIVFSCRKLLRSRKILNFLKQFS